jgi:formyltetrahydrofolate-dependent phosphoribosylglycinamide formyltransferase|tara:strand:- start:688 stop:1266 length:579 start_codon:yes stop_codon:yes gene_type:complete
MEKLTGKKINTAVFISGSGSNLNSIIKNSLKKNFPIKISLVISNNKNAYGINYAKNNKIKFKIINSKKMINFESKTLIILKKNNIKLICLAGFMKVLSDKFIKDFKYKILNIHPSLLPKYKGLNTHKRVLKNKEKFSGCTVHYVTNKLDSGRVILQKKVRIIKADNEKTLRKKILKIEHLLYPKAIKLALKN